MRTHKSNNPATTATKHRETVPGIGFKLTTHATTTCSMRIAALLQPRLNKSSHIWAKRPKNDKRQPHHPRHFRRNVTSYTVFERKERQKRSPRETPAITCANISSSMVRLQSLGYIHCLNAGRRALTDTMIPTSKSQPERTAH